MLPKWLPWLLFPKVVCCKLNSNARLPKRALIYLHINSFADRSIYCIYLNLLKNLLPAIFPPTR